MPHKSVAIVAAMARELVPLLRGVRSQRVDGAEVFEFADTAVAFGGIGRAAASRTSEAVITHYSPGVVISAGLVGALTPRLKVGDVVEVKEVIDVDSGATFETGRGEAVLVTGSVVAGPSDKSAEAQRWKADIVDMEASAVAAVAKAYGLEFMAIKAVSDELNFPVPPLGRFINANGKFDTVRFLRWLAIRPKWWSTVRQLNRNSNLAAEKLSRELNHLINQRVKAEQEHGIQRV